jgi:hypothetical protein
MKLAALPTDTALALGCVEIVGAVAPPVTVNVTALLVAEPMLLVATKV